MQRGRIGNRANSFTGERACSVDGQEAVGIAWGELRWKGATRKKRKAVGNAIAPKNCAPMSIPKSISNAWVLV